YRPIVDAARASLSGPRSDRFSRDEQATAARLGELADDEEPNVAAGTCYFAPRRLPDLAALFARHAGAVLLAGATDVGLWVTKDCRRLAILISVTNVRELQEITETPDRIEIGAGVTYPRLLPVFERHWPSFGEMLRRLGSVQIRNSGTM